MARPFLGSTLLEKSPVVFFTTIIPAVRGSCWGPSLGVLPGPGLPLSRSTRRLAVAHLVGGVCGRGRLNAVVAFVCHHDSHIMLLTYAARLIIGGIMYEAPRP